MDVGPGETYDVGMLLRGELDPDGSFGDAGVEVAYYNSADVEIGRDTVTVVAPGSIDMDWQRYSSTVTTPVNTASLRLWVRNEYTSGWLNYDDAFVIDPVADVKETVYYTAAGQNVAFSVGPDVTYVFSDHLGSTGVTYTPTAAPAEQINRQYYLPFGGVRHSDGLSTDVGFTGQRLDGSTGLMFYQARYYDPLAARFVSADTIIPNPNMSQDYNRYTYVRNNPLRYTDPSGHCWAVPGTKGQSCAGVAAAALDVVLEVSEEIVIAEVEETMIVVEFVARAATRTLLGNNSPESLKWASEHIFVDAGGCYLMACGDVEFQDGRVFAEVGAGGHDTLPGVTGGLASHRPDEITPQEGVGVYYNELGFSTPQFGGPSIEYGRVSPESDETWVQVGWNTPGAIGVHFTHGFSNEIPFGKEESFDSSVDHFVESYSSLWDWAHS